VNGFDRGRPVLLGLLAVLVAGCNWHAPRNNEFDPQRGGNIEGRVLTRSARAVAGAEVLVRDAGRLCYADSAGGFRLFGLPEESLRVVITADSFVPDSVTVALRRGVIDSIMVSLNGRPLVLACGLKTHVYGRNWPPDPLSFCEMTASVSDRDGDSDVDSVWVEVRDAVLRKRLEYDPDRRVFSSTLYAGSLPGQSLEPLVGCDFVFQVADREGATAAAPPTQIVRVMCCLPEPVFPSSGTDSLSGDTTFVWHRYKYDYPASYHGEVVRIEAGGPAGVALSFDRPAPDDTTGRVAISSLLSGEYYWTVEVIDGYGNSCRSAEQRFYVR